MLWRTIHARHNAGKGLWVLIGTLLLLSLLAGANFEGARKMYVAGQVAEHAGQTFAGVTGQPLEPPVLQSDVGNGVQIGTVGQIQKLFLKCGKILIHK